MVIEVDPIELWKTGRKYLPQTASAFNDAAGKVDVASTWQSDLFDYPDGTTAVSGMAWIQLREVVQDLINTTSRNVDLTAVAVCEICDSYVEADDEARAELDKWVTDNFDRKTIDSPPDRIYHDYDVDTMIDE